MPLIRRLPERNTRQGFFEKGEVEAVIAALPEPLPDIVRFAFLTGWRKCEVTGLQWAVDREGRVVRLAPDRSKNADGRVLTIDGPLGDLMARRWRARVLPASGDHTEVADLVFHRDGEPIRDFGKVWAPSATPVEFVHSSCTTAPSPETRSP